MEGSTEDLARSQLEKLYRLGVLERNSDGDERQQSENSWGNTRHDAFLAALPPPSLFPLNMLQSCVNSDSSRSSGNSSRSGGLYSGSGSTVSSQLPWRRKSQRSNSVHSSRSSGASYNAQTKTPRHRRVLRMLFRQWEYFIRYKREKNRRREAAIVFLKQKIFTKWAAFLKRRRYEHEQKRLLDSWRVSRTISHWLQWRRRCSTLRKLLNGGRRSLVGRLTQQRVWRRWIQFAKRKKYIQGILSERKDNIHRRLAKFVWVELRIHSFRARQETLVVRRCLEAIRDFAGAQEQKRLQCAQYQQKVNIGRKRELLQRWRAFAYASNRNRRLAWRVQFGIRRRRYFLLWCEVSRSVRHVERLRSRIVYRELFHHFSAWKTVVKAVQLADRVILKGDKRIQALYFRAFKDQVTFNIHCNHISLVLRRRRLAKAVRFLRAWTTEIIRRRNGICRIRNLWEKRLLHRVWVAGWLNIHRQIQIVKHGCLVLNARYFTAWKRFNQAQQILHLQEADAGSLHCKLCCRFVFRGWKAYHKLRMEHDQRLVKAEKYYHRHLLRKGILILWDAVQENARNSLRGHQLRQNLRASLKKRHFRAWHSYSQSKHRLLERFHYLRESVSYRNSVCNPRRRAWDRWVLFLFKCRQRHHCARHFQSRLKLRVLNIWRQQAKLEYQLRVFTAHKQRKTVEILFGCWKARANQCKKVAVICELAEKVYQRKLVTRVLREWLSRSTYLHRVRLCGESIHRQFLLKTLGMRFVEWQTEVEVRQCSTRLKRRRDRQLLQRVLTSWYKYSFQRNKLSRKLAHFQQVFGKYPASSLVFCTWSRWKSNCNRSRYVKALHRKHRLRQVKVCWEHWAFFHAACSALRAWHRVARALSTSNNRLGLRLRGFRRLLRCRIKKSSMDKWKTLVVRRRALQEQQSQLKHQLNRELEESRRKLEQAIRMRLGIWFRRFHTAHNKDNAVARRHFSCRLLSKAIALWWKATIHSKQEKVLVEAQKTMGKLSYYHPQQQIYIHSRCDSLKKKRKKMPKRKESTKVVPIDRVGSMLKMRRMLDPTEYASYSRFYQESGREVVKTKPDNETAKPLHGKDSVSRTNPVQQREYNHRNDSRGQDERNHWRVEEEADDRSSSGNGNTSCDNNNHRPTAEMGEHFYREQHPGLPETSDKSLATYSTVPENVLPLFDAEIPTKPNKNQNQPGSIPSTSRRVHFAPDPPAEQAVNTFLQPTCGARNGSIVPSVPDSEHKGRRQSPRALATASCVNALNTNSTTPRIFDASSSLISQSKSRVAKSRKSGQKKFIKVAHSSNTEVRPLADILQLNDANFPEHSEDHPVAPWRNNRTWDAAVIKEVVAFYVSLVVDQLGSNKGAKTTRLRVCFRMARDLALLQNDFYINELQRVYDANFKEKSTDLGHCGLETFKYEEQLNLELFLEQLVNSHPSYRKCVGSKQCPDPLNWLAQCHLQPQVLLQTNARGRTRQTTTFWIWEPMPAEMNVALEKLLPAITKYMRVLGQFFLREAVRSSSTGDKPQDYRISSTAFISLMKQVRVFPQLFHRRELENAVRLSCQSSPETEELNFPEFIEALVRCSCKLRWGELGGGKHTTESNHDTVVVIKFVMLIFAMEGQGSVLKKRSEDVGAILGFLGQQQKRNQAAKLFRFRKMLADNKRRTRASRDQKSPSVWNQIRLQFSPRSSPTRIPTRSHDTFDELTESWDGGSPRQVSTEPFVFDAQTNEPFDLDLPPTPNVERQSDQQQQLNAKEFVKNAGSICSGVIDETDLGPPLLRDSVGDVTEPREDAIQQTSVASQERQTPPFGEENVSSEYKSTAGPISMKESMLSEQRLMIRTHSVGLADPMEKDDFLREIMDNIGDVELMLSQARFADTKQSRQPPRKTLSDGSIQCTKAVECFPSLSELAGDGHWQHHTTDIFSSSEDATSEVQVRDPMLNYLTDIKRFTESAEHSSLVAIAEIPFTRSLAQDSLVEPHLWASQEIRPTEEVASNSAQASTNEINTIEDTIK